MHSYAYSLIMLQAYVYTYTLYFFLSHMKNHPPSSHVSVKTQQASSGLDHKCSVHLLPRHHSLQADIRRTTRAQSPSQPSHKASGGAQEGCKSTHECPRPLHIHSGCESVPSKFRARHRHRGCPHGRAHREREWRRCHRMAAQEFALSIFF